MKQEHFLSDGGLTPHFFLYFSFFEEEGLTLRRFIFQSSGLHQVENFWLLQCHMNEQQQKLY